MVFSARKKKSECLCLKAHLLRSPPLLSTPRLWAKAILFFSPSFKRWNRRCWMMDRCAGIVLSCSALKEIIDLHYSPTHETQPTTHTHTHTPSSTSYCSTPITAPPPTWQPTPRLLIKERMFISLPVFYRGAVLSQASGTTSPGLTWEWKAITPQHRLYKPAQSMSKPCISSRTIYTSGCIKWGLLQES